jgi:hypothetical protein
MATPFLNNIGDIKEPYNANLELVKYTLDIDTFDKLHPLALPDQYRKLELPKNYDIPLNVFEKKEIMQNFENEINPYEISIYFGKNNSFYKKNDQFVFYSNECYINRDFKNVKYIKILNCIVPRIYNYDTTASELKFTDMRFLLLRVDCNYDNNILSTKSELSHKFIKMKLKYNPSNEDKFIIFEPIVQEIQYNFKNSDLRKLDRLTLSLYDDNYNPLKLFLPLDPICVCEFIKNHSINFNIEIGVYNNEIPSSVNF